MHFLHLSATDISRKTNSFENTTFSYYFPICLELYWNHPKSSYFRFSHLLDEHKQRSLCCVFGIVTKTTLDALPLSLAYDCLTEEYSTIYFYVYMLSGIELKAGPF